MPNKRMLRHIKFESLNFFSPLKSCKMLHTILSLHGKNFTLWSHCISIRPSNEWPHEKNVWIVDHNTIESYYEAEHA